MNKNIAIFSTSIDEPTYGSVMKSLNSRGYDPWVYRADKVASGEDTLSLKVKKSSEFVLKYCGVEHDLNKLTSAWYRHPDLFCLNYEDKASQMCIENEISAIQESIWQKVPESTWLNNPYRMKKIQAKIAQLSLAASYGFNIPTTVISNNWDDIRVTIDEDIIAIKMSNGVIYKNNKSQVLYTSKINSKDISNLESNNPYPAIYQPFLDKKREWRVTVVGDRVFSSSIYCSLDADTDWRRYQLTDKVNFKNEQIPDDIAEKCVLFLKNNGLTYGAFDFIEDNEGKITFLECNTNGQYKWLENLLGYPISESIADELIKIYQQNS